MWCSVDSRLSVASPSVPFLLLCCRPSTHFYCFISTPLVFLPHLASYSQRALSSLLSLTVVSPLRKQEQGKATRQSLPPHSEIGTEKPLIWSWRDVRATGRDGCRLFIRGWTFNVVYYVLRKQHGRPLKIKHTSIAVLCRDVQLTFLTSFLANAQGRFNFFNWVLLHSFVAAVL